MESEMEPLPRNGDVIITIKDGIAQSWREVRHGRWLQPYHNRQYKKCSVCESVFSVNLPKNANYCPNCGAKMEEDKVVENEDGLVNVVSTWI